MKLTLATVTTLIVLVSATFASGQPPATRLPPSVVSTLRSLYGDFGIVDATDIDTEACEPSSG